MSLAYFENRFVSNSELKQIADLENGTEKPENLDEIFKLGRLYHEVLLEPHKAEVTYQQLLEECNGEEERINKVRDNWLLAKRMANTIISDPLCRQVIFMPDFRREHEFYKIRNEYGVDGVRCKCDGDTKLASTVFEYKGLSITTEKAFHASVQRFAYDQSCAWYLNATGYDRYLIAGVSKKDPNKIFKLLLTREHEYYTVGDAKVRKAIRIWKGFGLK